MPSPYVYDKAKYHYESVEGFGLPESHASNHTVPILRWFIENNLMSEFFLSECAGQLEGYRRGKLSIHKLYEWWDCCLVSDMVSDAGNAFGLHYFDFEKGKYISDYFTLLKGDLPSEFHVEYTEANYARLKERIDERFTRWSKSKKPWWQFWR